MQKLHSDVITGTLSAASPIELGQFLLLGRKTGTLRLRSGAREGTLFFLEGNVVAAVGPDNDRGEEAAMRVLKWVTGDFSFVPETVRPSDEIQVGTQNLLLETARTMDEGSVDENQIADALREADELSKTFAKIAQGSAEAAAGASHPHLAWLGAEAGRAVFRMGEHRPHGVVPGGNLVELVPAPDLDLPRVTNSAASKPPFDGWTLTRSGRFYVSWGPEGYRLLHPHPAPDVGAHVSDTGPVVAILQSGMPTALVGAGGSGKTLLAAGIARALADQTWRVLFVSGLPMHDLADGVRVMHEVIAPGQDASHVRATMQRWSPSVVVIDVDRRQDVADLVREAQHGGVRIILTVRASDEGSAQAQLRSLGVNPEAWMFASTSRLGTGPELGVMLSAA